MQATLPKEKTLAARLFSPAIGFVVVEATLPWFSANASKQEVGLSASSKPLLAIRSTRSYCEGGSTGPSGGSYPGSPPPPAGPPGLPQPPGTGAGGPATRGGG